MKTKIKLRCSTVNCKMRSGFYVSPEQVQIYLAKKCAYCSKKVVYIRLAGEK